MTPKDLINLFSGDPVEVSPRTVVAIVVAVATLSFFTASLWTSKENVEAAVVAQLSDIKDQLKGISTELNHLRIENANLRLEVAVLKREVELSRGSRLTATPTAYRQPEASIE